MTVFQDWFWRTRDAIERLFVPEEGQDMVEYALLAGFVSIIALAIILLVGPYLQDEFQHIVNELGTA